MGWIPGLQTKIPHDMLRGNQAHEPQLPGPCATTWEEPPPATARASQWAARRPSTAES